jgi:hypothetical protein
MTLQAATASNRSECNQPACPDLRVTVTGAPPNITADQFMTLTVVVSNADPVQRAAVLARTSLLRLTFSRPVGVVLIHRTTGYGCALEDVRLVDQSLLLVPGGPVPVTEFECLATIDDSIAPSESPRSPYRSAHRLTYATEPMSRN